MADQFERSGLDAAPRHLPPEDRFAMVPEDVLRLAEAFVFASPDPVTARTLASLLPEGQNPYVVLEALRRHCAQRGVVLAEVDGTWVLRTAPDLADRLRPAMAPQRRLPRAAMEVLALIAMRQSVTRTVTLSRSRGSWCQANIRLRTAT